MKKIMNFFEKNCKIYGTSTEDEILEFEKQTSVKIDDDYRAFLIQTNGVFVNNTLQIYIDELEEFIGIQVIYGVTSPIKENNVVFWSSELKGEIPDGAVVVGRDPGSNHFIFHTEGNKGIYYYDSSYFFEDPDEDENEEISTYFVASTFNEFVEKLTEY